VASICPSNPDQNFINASTPSLNVGGDRLLRFVQITLRDLIMLAYGIGAPQIQGPGFLNGRPDSPADRFDVMAKVPAGATLAAVCTRMTSADIAQQLQTLAPGYFRDGPVMDLSNLKGVYDFKLEWITAGQASNGSSAYDFRCGPGPARA
jgi:hypothetical protein